MTNSKQTLKRGMFFDKKEWDRQPCPTWEHVEKAIPKPIYDADPAAIEAYYHAWQMVVDVIQEPVSGSGFVSNYMFFDFNGADAVFAHDSALMTMFGRYAFRAFNAIETLDNFYARQHSNGEICREINRITGKDCWINKDGDPMTVHLEDSWGEHGGDWSKVKSYKWNRPTIKTAPPANCSIDGLTDHKFLWAELLNYRLTGNRKRLEQVITPLEKWYAASHTYLRDSNGLYITDWAGMDNSPRNIEMKYGESELAANLADNYWKTAVQIYKETGSVWEYFAPDHIAPGRSINPDNPGANARKDFAGWGAYPLISPFLEYGIGLKADAEKNILTWNLNETCRCGCANFAFGDIVTDLIAAPRNSLSEKPNIAYKTNHPYTLKLTWGDQKTSYNSELITVT